MFFLKKGIILATAPFLRNLQPVPIRFRESMTISHTLAKLESILCCLLLTRYFPWKSYGKVHKFNIPVRQSLLVNINRAKVLTILQKVKQNGFNAGI